MPPQQPLILTEDPELLEDLLRLAAAARVEAAVATSVHSLRTRWSWAPLVVLDVDTAQRLVSHEMPRRPGVVLVTRGHSETAWRTGMMLGCERVAWLPADEQWLLQSFAGLVEPPAKAGRIIGVVGGCGGSGASILTAGLAITAARSGITSTVVDLDPFGAGLELLLGEPAAAGVNWNDLRTSRGRLSSSALATGLPTAHGLRIVGWGAGNRGDLSAPAAASVLESLARSNDVVFVDLPRWATEAAVEAVVRATAVVLVVRRDVPAVAAALRLLRSPLLDGAPVGVAGRGPAPSRLTGADIADHLGVRLVGELPYDPRLAGDLEAGLPPAASGRSAFGRACARLLPALSVTTATGA